MHPPLSSSFFLLLLPATPPFLPVVPSQLENVDPSGARQPQNFQTKERIHFGSNVLEKVSKEDQGKSLLHLNPMNYFKGVGGVNRCFTPQKPPSVVPGKKGGSVR